MTSIGAVGLVSVIVVLCILPWMMAGGLLLHRALRIFRGQRMRRPPASAAGRGTVVLSGVVETHRERLVDCEEEVRDLEVSMFVRTPFGLRLPSGELVAVEPPAGWERQVRYSMVAPGEVALVEGVLAGGGGGVGSGGGGVYREPAATSRMLVAPPSGHIRIVPRRPPPLVAPSALVSLTLGLIASGIGVAVFTLMLGGYCVRLWSGHAATAVVEARRTEWHRDGKGTPNEVYFLAVSPPDGSRQEITVDRDDYLTLVDGARVPVIVVPHAPSYTQLGPAPHPDVPLAAVLMTTLATLVVAMVTVRDRDQLLAYPVTPYRVV